jgi:LuxR family maltose regulon positive regulatory protein
LRFTPSEAATFLNQVMGLTLSDQDIAALEKRTEGWIAGLQFAALALQGHQDTTRFITSFTGSHHFVLDYLVEEVIEQQEVHIQTFLLRTSILEQLSGSLCDAVVLDASHSGQATLEYLERANLFIVPLDNERRWYRYHHLFAQLLCKLLQSTSISSTSGEVLPIAALHQRASVWYEEHGLELEAFHHAVAANDLDRAARLVEGKGMSLPFPGGNRWKLWNWTPDRHCGWYMPRRSCLSATISPPSKRNSRPPKPHCKARNWTTEPGISSDRSPPCEPR